MRDYEIRGNIVEVEHEGKTYKVVNYSKPEEYANAISHGAAALIYLFAMVALIYAYRDYPRGIIAVILQCLSAILVFGVSAVYHLVDNIAAKAIWRKIDHSTVPFLVMGCSAGICLCLSNYTYNYIAIGASFAMSVSGIVMNFMGVDRFKVPTMIINFVIGVLLFGVFMLNRSLITYEIGAAYALGTILCIGSSILFGIKIKFMHFIFHLGVVAGTLLFLVATILIIRGAI